MRITPLDVHEQTFRISFRGFDPVEVDAFLQRVADELERLIEERDHLKAQLERESQARSTLDEALAAAQTLQEGILERARGEAELLLNQAQLKSDRALAQANEELVSVQRELQELRERRAVWLGEITALAGTLQQWAETRAAQPQGEPSLLTDDNPAPSGGAATQEPPIADDEPLDDGD